MILLLLLSCSILANSCELLKDSTMGVDEQQLIDRIKLNNLTDDNAIDCLKICLRKGLFEVAEQIVAVYAHIKSSVYHNVYEEELSKITAFSRSLVVGISTIAPVIKWAQSNETVMVAFKLSHRWDSPPCTQSHHENWTVVSGNLDYLNQCVVSRHKIRFRIGMQLWEELPRQNVEIRREGVGTYVINMKKLTPAIWPYLDRSQERYPIWVELAQRFEEHMKEFRKLEEEELKSSKRNQKNMWRLRMLLALLMFSLLV